MSLLRAQAVSLMGVVAFAALAAGCTATPPAPAMSLGPHEYAVPIANWAGPGGAELLCAGGGFGGALHGSATDPRHVWATTEDGSRLELAWPPDYRAAFSTGFELLDATGKVIGGEGTQITGGCVTADPNVYEVDLATPAPTT